MMFCSLFLILIYGIFPFKGQSAFITTLVPQSSPYLESGTVTLVQISAISFQYICAITYKTAKTTLPLVTISYNSVDYDLNKKFTTNASLLLNINLYTALSSTTGFTALAEVITTYHLKSIKYSYLVMDPVFPYFSSFSFKFINFPIKDTFISLDHPAAAPIFAIFLWGLNYEVDPSSLISTELFGFHW